MKEKIYNVYIATNYPRCTVLYTGVTNNIFARGYQQKTKLIKIVLQLGIILTELFIMKHMMILKML